MLDLTSNKYSIGDHVICNGYPGVIVELDHRVAPPGDVFHTHIVVRLDRGDVATDPESLDIAGN